MITKRVHALTILAVILLASTASPSGVDAQVRSGASTVPAVTNPVERDRSTTVETRRRNPKIALLASVVPGLGNFYTGDRIAGTAVAGAVAGSIVLGATSTRTRVFCLSPVVAGTCPEGRIHHTTEEHHMWGHALVGAAAFTVAGAVYAYIRADRGAPASVLTNDGSPEPTISVGSVDVEGGRVRLSLLRLQF